MFVALISICVVWFCWFYWKFHRRVQYWKNLGIPGPEQSLFFGNFKPFLTKNRAQIDLEWTRQFGPLYIYESPQGSVLMVTDAELIKQICIKDFQHFINRQKLNAYHELWNENMLNAEAEQWKKLRTIASPTFTSIKLRGMHKLMKQCIDKLVVYLDKVADDNGIIKDTKGVMSGFSIDVIASTSFGTETNANGSRTKVDPIVEKGKEFFNIKPLKGFVAFTFPRWLLNIFGIRSFFNSNSLEFFGRLTREMLKQRKEGKVKRNDFIQLLLDAEVDEQVLNSTNYDSLTADGHKDVNLNSKTDNFSTKKTLTEVEIVAQCILFFTAGFETTASTIFHAVYMFAKNPEFQEQLYSEIIAVASDLDENSDEYFEKILNEIPLLEATIKEVLRMFPPISIMFRRLVTDGYSLAGHKLPKDLNIDISNYVVHHNPEYYPDPERFDPQRFMPENAHLLKPYTYLPFGLGPRNCLGMRFAYQEIKFCLAKLICLYRFSRTEGTPDEPTFAPGLPLLVTTTFPIAIAKRN